MAEPNYYKVLQLDPDAEQEIVKAVYWRLSQKYHPDGSQPDPEKMRQINEAHEVIGDPARRKRYDSHRQYGWDPVKDSEPARSPSYWNPPQSVYDPASRTPRRKYRSSFGPGPLGILGAMAILVFMAVILQSGFNIVQLAAKPISPTPTNLPPKIVTFEVSSDDLKAGLTSLGFDFSVTGPEAVSIEGYNKQIDTSVTLVEHDSGVESVELSFVESEDPDVRPFALERQEAVLGLLNNLQVSKEDSEYLAHWIDSLMGYSFDVAMLQLNGLIVELNQPADSQTVVVLFRPAP